jgi:hypothetical protein
VSPGTAVPLADPPVWAAPSRMRSRLIFCFGVLVTLATCDASGPTGASIGGGAAQLGADGYGRDWVGVYVGTGRGVVGTMNVEVRDAQLTIVLDAGEDRLPSCPQCVTITLDTLFSAINVSLADPQSVVVRYVAELTHLFRSQRLGRVHARGTGGRDPTREQ